MIRAASLSKSFGDLRAVDDVSLTLAPGEAFGLLGPNGAGKTTTINMLVGVLAPDSGSVEIEGHGPPTDPAVRRVIGVAPQALAIYDELTGDENLQFMGKLFGLRGSRLRDRINWALNFAGLTDRRKGRAGTYSGGMKRRLNLAAALIHEPRVILLDEPTVGVDPQSRSHLFDCVEQLKAEGVTILYTTHYMEEAERLCDRVAIMDHGKLLALDTVEGLIEAHGGNSIVHARFRRPPDDPSSLPAPLTNNAVSFDTNAPLQAVESLTRYGDAIETLSVERPNLEAVFLNLTGRSLRDD